MSQLMTGGVVRRVRTPISILGLLDWAFRLEKAQLTFGELDGFDEPRGYGLEYVMIEQAKLGCRIDGGGSSPVHPDADLVADAVARLPEGCGGPRMAITIAEHARVGATPDWGRAVAPACAPVEWQRCKHGVYGKRVLWEGPGRWPPNRLGRDDGYACPVSFSGMASEVAARRRSYTQWRLALLELRTTFKTFDNLSAWDVTSDLPPRAPWMVQEKTA